MGHQIQFYKISVSVWKGDMPFSSFNVPNITFQRTLTWRLENTARNLGRDAIRGELKKAFDLWQKNANINFRETSETKADILVKFATGNHGDPYYFDKRGGTLAHAFYPYPGLSKLSNKLSTFINTFFGMLIECECDLL